MKKLLLILLALSSLSFGQAAYIKAVDAKTLTASGAVFTHLNVIGELNIQAEYVISGSPTITSIVMMGCMRGGTCATLNTYTNSTSTLVGVTGLYDYYTVTPTWTGGTSPSVTVNWIGTANSSPSSSVSNVTVQGGAASGATASGNPVLVAGQNGTTVETVETDTGGRVQVVGGAASGNPDNQNPINIGVNSGGSIYQVNGDTAGNLAVRVDGGSPFSCTITLSSNATTACQSVAGAGLRNYVQSYQIYTTVAGTATTITLESGNTASCTSPVAFTPAYANTTAAAVNTNGIVVNFGGSGWRPSTSNTAICAVQAGTTAGTTMVVINGFIAP